MYRSLYCVLLTLTLGLMIACNPQPEAPSLLQQAQQIMDEQPDSALRLIDSIYYPKGSLSREQYMQYLVALVQARKKNYLDVAADTLIFEAEQYFARQGKDSRQIALAKFYSGGVCRDQGLYEPAMSYYKEAETHAQKIQDYDLQGLIHYHIGDLFYQQGLYTQALEKYRMAGTYYQSDPEKLSYALNAMGRTFVLSDEIDSGFYYFHRALDLADSIGHDILQANLAQSLAVTYREVERYEEAEEHLRQAMLLNTDSINLPRLYLNMAKLYQSVPQVDSVRRYAQKLLENMHLQESKTFQASAFGFLTEWEQEQGNYAIALDYQDKYTDVLTQIMRERMDQSVYEVEQKYNYEQMQVQHYRAQAVWLRWIVALLGLLIVGGALSVRYWIRQKNKQAEVQHHIDTLTEMNRDLEMSVDKKQRILHKDLLRQLNIASKVAEINEEIDKKSKNGSESTSLLPRLNHIIYGQRTIDDQWGALLQIFKDARPGYAEKIREKYPDLTESEFRIGILTYASFSIKEIAVILGQSANTIQVRRTTLRQKMGLPGGSDISERIEQIVH